jgi:thiamine biosynthesis lipoprotein ApbE
MTTVAGRVGTGDADVQRWPALGTTVVLCTHGGSRVGSGEPLDEGRDAPAARDPEAWRSVELSERPPAVRVPAGRQLDLGATAKALAADRGARAAHLAGGAGTLISLGGDSEANIASTAALVLGNEAPAWLAAHNLPARLVTVDGAVETQGGWPR